MSLLVGPQDLIQIQIYYTIKKNKHNASFVTVLEEKKAKDLMKNPDTSKSVEVLSVNMKPQTWQAQNDLFLSSTVYNPTNGTKDVDWTKYRDSRLKATLVSWSITDDAGKEVPVTPENIDQLHASIANAICNEYDKATSMEGDEASK